MDISHALGFAIRAAADTANIPLAALADRAHIPRSTLYTYLDGTRHIPINRIATLAHLLDTTPTALVAHADAWATPAPQADDRTPTALAAMDGPPTDAVVDAALLAYVTEQYRTAKPSLTLEGAAILAADDLSDDPTRVRRNAMRAALLTAAAAARDEYDELCAHASA